MRPTAQAQFQVVADEATKIEEGAATALSLKLQGSWLSGLRFSRDGSGRFLFCIIADEPLSRKVIDVAITPNRPDALGVYGIARDLAAKGLGKLKPLDVPAIKGSYTSPVNVELKPSVPSPSTV